MAENAHAPPLSPKITPEELAGMIDHTRLKAFDPPKRIERVCREALEYNFASVCIEPVFVPLCAKMLSGSSVMVCTVIGFPLGANSSKIKALEAKAAVEEGAQEVDMVVNVGFVRAGMDAEVLAEIGGVVDVAKAGNAKTKVILETGYLTEEELVKACKLCVQAKADFVKTSTGYGPRGALPREIRIMRETVGPNIGVKASGGIQNFRDAIELIEAGANRIGTSASISIIEGYTWATLTGAWFSKESPCWKCPSRKTNLSKVPKELFLYYKKKCQSCPYNKEFNKFYE